MNLFSLHRDHELNARAHCDKHVVKMPVEVAQLLSTAVRILAREQGVDLSSPLSSLLYRETHRNHPCAVWTRTSMDAFLWVVEYGESLCAEYTYRYGKNHAAKRVIEACDCLDTFYGLTPAENPEPQPQCMPEQYRVPGNPVKAYRAYFCGEKSHLAQWTNRPVPRWFKETQTSELP